MRLADGNWAVPEGLDEQADALAEDTVTEQELTRARSFAAAGTDLVWDGTRTTPLSGEVIHATDTKPYAVTCSSFADMVLMGWDYEHTTYVADENTQVGESVDFGPAAQNGELKSAADLARWFHAHGETWLDDGSGQYRPGDVLFFSQQPTVDTDSPATDADLSRFANIYHVAIYVGDGRIIHSYGQESGAGVVEEDLPASLHDDLSFVARPYVDASSPESPDGTPSDPAAQSPSQTAPAPAASQTPAETPAGPGSAVATDPVATDPAGRGTDEDAVQTPDQSSQGPGPHPWSLPRTGGSILSFIGTVMVAVGAAASLVTKRRSG